jgi:iron-sulfur cluster assembly accessory protein
MIEITTAAFQEIKRLQNSRGQLDSYLRLGVGYGGCSGLYYTLELSKEIQPSDLRYESQGLTIVVASASGPYLEQLQLDYAEDLMGGGFRFQNLAAINPCSCGLSFNFPDVDRLR